MPWFNIEFRYEDEIEAENEEFAHEIVMTRLRNGELDIIVEITEIKDGPKNVR